MVAVASQMPTGSYLGGRVRVQPPRNYDEKNQSACPAQSDFSTYRFTAWSFNVDQFMQTFDS